MCVCPSVCVCVCVCVCVYVCVQNVSREVVFPRIPEVLFEGSEVWAAVEEEELLEIQEVLQTFIYSVFMQRMHHAIMEVNRKITQPPTVT